MKNSTSLMTPLLAIALLSFSCQNEGIIDEPGNLVPKTVDQDPRLPSISVNGAQLHAEAFGNANDPMIIVLHGGPGNDYRNLLYCKDFASQGYRVIFYDQRGSGLSQRFPYSFYKMDDMFNDLKAVIAYYRTSPTQKVFLLGHSWGAMLATAYINQYPAAITGAILAEPGGFIWKDIKDYNSKLGKLDPMSETVSDALYVEQFITAKQNDHAALDYKFGLWAATSEAPGSPIGNEGRTMHWRQGAVVFHAYQDLGEAQKPDWTNNLSQYTTKVLFIYSEHNTAYGLTHAQKVSSAYPNVQLFEAKDAGHDMMSFPTGWNNTYPVMLDYLNTLK